MTSKALIPLLVTMMLLTGVCNTLLTKYQDNQCVRDCDNPDPKKRQNFSQPVLQTIQMFIGENLSWLFIGTFALYQRYDERRARPRSQGYSAVNTTENEPVGILDTDANSIRSNEPMNPAVKVLTKNSEERLPLKGSKVSLLALPAICDICGTTLMNVGLLFVVASIYQMTRGALVLFVGLFSVVFLKKHLYLYQWSALVIVVLGVGLVGLAGALYKDNNATPAAALLLTKDAAVRTVSVARAPEVVRTIIGILLIGGAQIFTATQFVLEEFILEKYALEPLKVVGWEGLFGMLITALGMLVLHLAIGRTDAGQYGYFDAVEGWRQITTNRAVGLSSILIMISIGGFNFFGLSVTRTVSATSRSTIDTCRTLFIWIVSLGLGWESFKWLQVLGFALLVYGTFLFNNIVRPPLKSCVVSQMEAEELLPEEPIEHF